MIAPSKLTPAAHERHEITVDFGERTLFPHQAQALEATKDKTNAAYYYRPGSGKTLMAIATMARWTQEGERHSNAHIWICQKSKVADHVKDLIRYTRGANIYDLTKPKSLAGYLADEGLKIGVINYDMIWRRAELLQISYETATFDESSLLQRWATKRTKACANLKAAHKQLLSGTPVSGKYERIGTQARMLGWYVTYKELLERYCYTQPLYIGSQGITQVTGYHDAADLRKRMEAVGAVFEPDNLDLNLPDARTIDIDCDAGKQWTVFRRRKVVTVDEHEFVGADPLSSLTAERQLCGSYCRDKLARVADLLESLEGRRVIVFYAFQRDRDQLEAIVSKTGRNISTVDGRGSDLTAYERDEDSITLIQYQSGSMGLNLQKACYTIFYDAPLSCELYTQAQARTHRLKQRNTCTYYRLIAGVENQIYQTLARGIDYTERLFEAEETEAATGTE